MASKPGLNRNSSNANRLPAPSLFIGPPSRNASNTSIIPPTSTPGGITPGSRAPALARQRSQRGIGNDPQNDSNPMSPTTTTSAGGAGGLSRKDTTAPPPQSITVAATAAAAAEATLQQQPSTDAIWAEMQNTLEEVELSALNGTHVFRPGHSSALDELRTAQIALAQAWARSEADEDESEEDRRPAVANKPLSAANVLANDRDQKLAGGSAGGGTGSAGGAGAGGGGRPRSGTETSAKSQLERDTENDIQLARKRREANDRYFQRVNAGVLDVVAKLEEVAKAMKGVEQESKEIWGDGESVDTASFMSK
ncbi:hypothetical protein GTA08_BOTSDO01143 [Botryosphaeria dothidea]|uniref:Uncharacterized protein n=1 Tax=Botryosphaeria dothidea TaxID=55169 RepID=A0A8H4NAU0_9PEZI|nr:hypothetical protein GTA08_BOTSDO01143 [Botryosphaeria dothidea]